MLTAAACGGGSPADEEAPEVVEGIVVGMDSRLLGDVESFTIKDGDTTYEIFVDPEREYGFPVSHLSEHVVSGEPVRVELEERNGRLYAVTIEDV